MKRKKILFSVVTFILLIFTISCKEAPGPISVKNNISPTVVTSGSYIDWEVEVTNSGGEVKIERAHCREVAISGWAVGSYDFEIDLPISNYDIDAHSIEVIFELSSPLYNTGPTDVQFENTVTVYSDGGTVSDSSIYTVKSSSSASMYIIPKSEDVKGLIFFADK